MKPNTTTLMWFIVLVLVVTLDGCHQYDNFTTYFNTYYNSKRLLDESRDEFAFGDEIKRKDPRVFVPEPTIKFPGVRQESGTPPFLQEFVISEKDLKPVETKLDSIEIKGSKILARHPKSDYIEGTLYLMALSYFYRSSWLPSQVKCSELIDRYPDGELSPDAHLLFSENLLIQRKFHAGKVMLSRTVDIAWQKDRYDILSEAFRFQAELALYENDMEGAIRPYKQAIAQADDEGVRARWQIDMASLYYRMSKFKEAEKAFARARDFSPDYLGTFESYLYQAQSMIRLGRFDEAETILGSLEHDGKFEEWLPFVLAARMNIYRLKKNDTEFLAAEKFADSTYLSNPAVLAVYYEKAMDYFNNHDYNMARKYFARSRNVRTPVFETSQQMFYLLNNWSQKLSDINQFTKKLDENPSNDTIKGRLAITNFDLGRVHEQLGNKDSALVYYQAAVTVSPAADSSSARYLYAWSRVLQESNPEKSDSLLEYLVQTYPSTEYGKEAIVKQGYTDKFVIDSVAELYSSGNSLRQNKEYNFALSQFTKIYTRYPESYYAPKALYSIGWTFERDLKMQDSALFYYNLLIEKYPNSEYAKDVRLSVDYLTAVRSGGPIPDSLNKKAYVPRQKFDPIKGHINQPPPPPNPALVKDRKKGGFNPMDVLNDPGKALRDSWNGAKDEFNSTKDKLMKPENLIPDMKLPVDPSKFLKPGSDSTSTDSTKTIDPELKK